MDVATIAIVTATTALVSAVVGPLVTFIVSTRSDAAAITHAGRAVLRAE